MDKYNFSNKSYKNLAAFALPLFIFWPFGAFILSLFDIRRKTSAVVYVLFVILYGYSFSFEDTSADSYRLAMVFVNYFNYSSLKEIIDIFLLGGLTDLYLKLSYGIVKQFTNNPKFLFAFLGILFGIFSYKSLALLVKERMLKNNLYFFIIALVFFSIYPITTLNGARFNTAALVFFVSIINILIYKKRLWYIGLFSTILIHFSYIVAVPVVLLVFFILPLAKNDSKIFNWVYYVFFISLLVTFFIPVNALPFESLLNFDMFSSSVGNKFENYTSDELTKVMADRSKTLFHTVSKWFGNIIKVYLLIMVLIIKKNTRNNLYSNDLLKLLAFILLFSSFGFFAQTIPSGGRFLMNGYMFFIYLLYRMYNQTPNKIFNNYILGLSPVFSFKILFTIGYICFISVSYTLFYGNLIWIIYEGLGFADSF